MSDDNDQRDSTGSANQGQTTRRRSGPVQPADDPGRDASQPDRHVADVPVLVAGGTGQRLAPGPPGQPGGRRRGPGDGRGDGRDPRGADHPGRHGDLGRSPHRAAGADRPVRPVAGGRRGHPACPRRPQGQLRPALERGQEPEDPGRRGAGRSSAPARSRSPRATPCPSPLDEAGIDGVVAAFEAAARRALPPGSSSSRSTRPTATCSTSSSRR